MTTTDEMQWSVDISILGNKSPYLQPSPKARHHCLGFRDHTMVQGGFFVTSITSSVSDKNNRALRVRQRDEEQSQKGRHPTATWRDEIPA